MEMQPKKKKGKGCLIAIGVVFGIAILVGVLSNLGGGVKVTNDKDGNVISVKNQAKEAEESYMSKLEENREAIMEKVFVEKDDVENVTRYYPKNCPIDKLENGVYIKFSERDGKLTSMGVLFQYDGDENILFDEIVINVDGETHVVKLSPTDMLNKSLDIRIGGYHERAILGLKGELKDAIYKIPNADKVVVRYKGTNITKHQSDYVMTPSEKQAIRDMIDAYQLLNEDFLYDFDSAE